MPVEKTKLEENKKTVVIFYQEALFEGDVDTAIRMYGGKTYKQHPPFIADGSDGLRSYVKWITKNYPRVEDGKVVEHWHFIQSIPKQSLNNNTMF